VLNIPTHPGGISANIKTLQWLTIQESASPVNENVEIAPLRRKKRRFADTVEDGVGQIDQIVVDLHGPTRPVRRWWRYRFAVLVAGRWQHASACRHQESTLRPRVDDALHDQQHGQAELGAAVFRGSAARRRSVSGFL